MTDTATQRARLKTTSLHRPGDLWIGGENGSQAANSARYRPIAEVPFLLAALPPAHASGGATRHLGNGPGLVCRRWNDGSPRFVQPAITERVKFKSPLVLANRAVEGGRLLPRCFKSR